MMMDTAWGASAPNIGGLGSMSFPDTAFTESGMSGMTDDDLEGMIGLGFFQEKDDEFGLKNDIMGISTPFPSTTSETNSTAIPKYAPVSPTHQPIDTIDTGAVVAIPTQKLNVQAPLAVVSDTRCNSSIALPGPPQLVSNCQSPVNVGDNDKESVQDVLKQQQETIMHNQKIIEAQKNELKEQQIHHMPLPLPMPMTMAMPITVHSLPSTEPSSPKTSASYPLAHAALKKADELVIDGNKNSRGTKRKASQLPDGSSTEANAYQKWKLTPDGASKLRAVDSGPIKNSEQTNKKQDVAAGKKLNMLELEVRRERNRKHAKKSRLRKKCLTSDLEQSLQTLKDENIKLRKQIEDHFAKKKDSKESSETVESVDTLLQKHRISSHERFIACLRSGPRRSTKGRRKSKDATKKKKISCTASGKGFVVDDKTLKVLKGLSKSIISSPPKKETK